MPGGGVEPIKSKSLPPFSVVRMEEGGREGRRKEGRKEPRKEGTKDWGFQNVAYNRAEQINIYSQLLSWAVFFCTTSLTFAISR